MRRLIVALVAATAMLFTTACNEGARSSFKENCARADGHQYGSYGLLLCLDDDGHVLEVYP